MILSDREIMAAIERGVVRITGNLERDASKWSSTALDLTLDSSLQVWKKMGGAGAQTIVDPMDPQFNATVCVVKVIDVKFADSDQGI